jgi:hypothetical protein
MKAELPFGSPRKKLSLFKSIFKKLKKNLESKKKWFSNSNNFKRKKKTISTFIEKKKLVHQRYSIFLKNNK